MSQILPLEADRPNIIQTNWEKTQTLCRHAFLNCNTSWIGISWRGIVLYIASLCVNYAIGYNVYKYADIGMWHNQTHSYVRIVGDIVTVSWFGLGIIALPWHKWEEFTCIGDPTRAGCARYSAWMVGMIFTMILYGWLRNKPLGVPNIVKHRGDDTRTDWSVCSYIYIGCGRCCLLVCQVMQW